MHVASLQSQPAASQPRSCATGHAFAPATARVPTVAEAMAMTQQLRHSEQAVCQEVILCFHVLSTIITLLHLTSYKVTKLAVL